MLDRDLAEIYGIETRRLKVQVKRNKERFPANFMFELTENEIEIMVSQNAIPSKQVLGGSRPYAFTEHGILMLANVLRSGKAVQISIKIIEVFIKMREMLVTNKELLSRIEKIENNVSGQGHEIKVLFDFLKRLMAEKKQREEHESRKRIGFKKEE